MADDKPGPEQPSTNFTDDELEEKLSAFDNRVKAASKKVMPDVPEWNYQPKGKLPTEPTQNDDGIKSIGIGFSAAYGLVGGMAVGFGTGWLLDRHFHSSPLWSAVLGLLGTFVGLAYVFILVSRSSK